MTTIQWHSANSSSGKSLAGSKPDETRQSRFWFGLSLMLMGLIAGIELGRLWLTQLK